MTATSKLGVDIPEYLLPLEAQAARQTDRRIAELEKRAAKVPPSVQSWVRAVFEADAGKLSGKNARPYQWLLDSMLFGTMLYNYLRGSTVSKRLSMKHVCQEWVDRSGHPINYNSLKTRKEEALEGRLPDKLDKALAEAGWPFTPPSKRIVRRNAGKMGKRLTTTHPAPYYDSRRKVNPT
jgi:hypothetical protein